VVRSLRGATERGIGEMRADGGRSASPDAGLASRRTGREAGVLLAAAGSLNSVGRGGAARTRTIGAHVSEPPRTARA